MKNLEKNSKSVGGIQFLTGGIVNTNERLEREQNSPYACFNTEFNPSEYYCIEYRNFNDFADGDKEKMREKEEKRLALSELKKYVKSYYSQKDYKRILDEKLKGF